MAGWEGCLTYHEHSKNLFSWRNYPKPSLLNAVGLVGLEGKASLPCTPYQFFPGPPAEALYACACPLGQLNTANPPTYRGDDLGDANKP